MEESYLSKLRKATDITKSIISMGMDPVLEAIPTEAYYYESEFSDANKAWQFYLRIIDEMNRQDTYPGAIKLNLGFWQLFDNISHHEYQGSTALKRTIQALRDEIPPIPIILDCKDGDIGKSSANYAKIDIANWEVDAITISPYMGTDSVIPFLKYTKNGKGVYILDKTSNPGGKDFQDLKVIDPEKLYKSIEEILMEDKKTKDAHAINPVEALPHIQQLINQIPPLYMEVAQKIYEWSKEYNGSGAVVGATNPQELEQIAKFYTGKDIPLLIPGVGGQGGSASEVTNILKQTGYDLKIVRINSSSGLTHPWTKAKDAPKEYYKQVIENLKTLNLETSLN